MIVKTTKIKDDWQPLLAKEFRKNYFIKLHLFILEENKKYNVYPEYKDIFNAFKLCSFKKLKVVIIGQDPYHKVGQAHGLAFSVKTKNQHPPSLKNILTELKNDININNLNNGDLSNWAKQGVLLLNSLLTVRENEPTSHQNIGWEKFTNHVIQLISDQKNNIVFLIWGKHAAEKIRYIDKAKHHILISSHPSPLSAYRGFFGSNHFSRTNNFLIEKNIKPINWNL